MDEEYVTHLNIDGKEIILLGTAHVSAKSANQVREVIEREKPDSVCVELDEQRYKSIIDRDRWMNMDLFKLIKDKKATLLLMNLIISSFQRRIAKQFGIKPGQEMIQGVESCREIGAKLVLADRDIQVTFARIWRGIGIFGKLKLMVLIIYSIIFESEEITEEEIEKMKTKDMLGAMLNDFTEFFPLLKKPLVDERDQYLAQKIKDAPGDKVVAVLGAAHVPGIKEEIYKEHSLDSLNYIPPKSKIGKIVPWFIPLAIIFLIAYTFTNNPTAGMQQTVSWILWNGSFSAIFAALAFGHPLTIITAFLVAPLSSLNPLMAAGWFAGIVQAGISRPSVEDFENIPVDVNSLKGFWHNRVTRILLVVVLTNLGSTIGTLIGGADVIRLFLGA